MVIFVDDILAGVNEIIQQLINIGADIFSFFVTFLLALYYPIAVVIWCIQTMIEVLYNTFIPILNVIINIANFPIILVQAVFVVPPVWSSILYIMLLMIVTVKSIRWIRTIPIIGKYFVGTGDK